MNTAAVDSVIVRHRPHWWHRGMPGAVWPAPGYGFLPLLPAVMAPVRLQAPRTVVLARAAGETFELAELSWQ